eukprot:TRINITY_DN588_c0_g1_i2.p1 TRINITY_DN588_c0_g1~~TRINITY_DN588_c0_g1_i2.p1  ORF type:complete len:1154 (-),score=254.94 TRINITY_DN588_c0_g1_i2:52-3477(-)
MSGSRASPVSQTFGDVLRVTSDDWYALRYTNTSHTGYFGVHIYAENLSDKPLKDVKLSLHTRDTGASWNYILVNSSGAVVEQPYLAEVGDIPPKQKKEATIWVSIRPSKSGTTGDPESFIGQLTITPQFAVDFVFKEEVIVPTNLSVTGKPDYSTIVSAKIHPSIGICRIGNSPTEYILSPEYPDEPAKPSRDANGKLKRQVQRFRILGYDAKGNFVKEIKEGEDVAISWTVELANKKASWYNFHGKLHPDKDLRNEKLYPETDPEKRTELINRPGPRTVDAKTTVNKFEGGKIFGKEAPYLGEIRYSDEGRLLVFSGLGYSASPFNNYILDYANNDGWFDDSADGPVSATVKIDGKEIKVTPAWVVVGPPKYAPEHRNIVTLYEMMLQTALKSPELSKGLEKMPKDFPLNPNREKVEYYSDIYPMFERLSQHSWVHTWALKGHGIHTRGHFTSEFWEKKLTNTDKSELELRKSIYFRLRKPITGPNDPEFSNAVGQANFYFMPVMSGDDDQITQGNPLSWMSLTPKMYSDFEKWANGNFDVKPEMKHFWRKWKNLSELEELRPDLVPWAIDLASLEWAVGGPFFPGIEVTYIVENPASFSEPFRFNRNWTAGDATKHMALPWQADFNECEYHWWPAARPDSILPLYSLKQKGDQHVAADPNQRQRWTRGFRKNEEEIKWGNIDMVYNWDKLGFITSRKIVDTSKETQSVIDSFVEVDRLAIFVGEILPNKSKKEDLKTLLRYLKGALRVELSTIPPYLFALYSLPDAIYEKIMRDGDPGVEMPESLKIAAQIQNTIKTVVVEEMLHLSLVANVLVAVSPDPEDLGFNFYSQTSIPKYPTNLPYKDKPLSIYLLPASSNVINTFAKIEEPDQPLPVVHKRMFRSLQLEHEEIYTHDIEEIGSAYKFDTIGSFYDDVIKLINTLKIEWPDPKHPKYDLYTKLQMAPGTAFYPTSDSGGVVLVTNKEDATRALDIIQKQGEGSKTTSTTETSHWHKFVQIQSLPNDWEKLVLPADAELTKISTHNELVQKTNKAFNAVYCYCLKSLDKIYRTSDEHKKRTCILGGLFNSMRNILPIIARILMKQSLGLRNAGPTFEFYHFEVGSTKEQVVKLVEEAAKLYTNPIETGLWDQVIAASKGLCEVD